MGALSPAPVSVDLEALFRPVRPVDDGVGAGLFLPDSTLRGTAQWQHRQLIAGTIGLAMACLDERVPRIIVRRKFGLDPDNLPELTPEIKTQLGAGLMQHLGSILRGLDSLVFDDKGMAVDTLDHLVKIHERFSDGDGILATSPKLWTWTLMSFVLGMGWVAQEFERADLRALVNGGAGLPASQRVYDELLKHREALGVAGDWPPQFSHLLPFMLEKAYGRLGVDRAPELSRAAVDALLEVPVMSPVFTTDGWIVLLQAVFPTPSAHFYRMVTAPSLIRAQRILQIERSEQPDRTPRALAAERRRTKHSSTSM